MTGEPMQRRAGVLCRFRSWWHQPVIDRLDRIEAAVTPRLPGAYPATARARERYRWDHPVFGGDEARSRS